MRIAPLLLAAIIGAGPLAGCKDDDKKTGGNAPAAPQQPGGAAAGANPAPAKSPLATASRGFQGIRLEAPRDDWDWAESETAKGMELVGPATAADASWKPYMFFEVINVPDEKPIDKILDEAVPSLEAAKTGFKLIDKKVIKHPNGYSYGRIQYTNNRDGIPLTQWEIVLPMEGKKRVQIQASAGSSSWKQYEPIFAAVIDSIKLPS